MFRRLHIAEQLVSFLALTLNYCDEFFKVTKSFKVIHLISDKHTVSQHSNALRQMIADDYPDLAITEFSILLVFDDRFLNSD